jgi:hypothetical protein
MSDFDWKAALGKLAPVAASLIGGPAAGMAVEAIGSALGISDATEDKIKDHIQQGKLTGEQIVALRAADDNLKIKLAEIGLKHEELAYGDIKDARARDVAFVAAGKINYRADLLVAGAMAAFGYSIWFLFYNEFPAPNREILIYLFGVLTKIVTDIYNFEFSSTRSSKEKTELLAKAEAIK